MRVTAQVLQGTFEHILRGRGVAPAAAVETAEVFTSNTIDGVPSHGINRFPRVISYIDKGHIDVAAIAAPVARLGALERWEGNRAMGVLNAKRCTTRAIELARVHGIGCVALRNTNHWMRGGYYGWRAAEAGCIALLWTNTMPNMPPWGGTDPRLGNNPFVVAIPHSAGHVVMDAAMSQYSYGKLESTSMAGELLPYPGGFDTEGHLSTDPAAILKSWRVLPMGFWKGSGLSLVLDLVAAVLSQGHSTREIGTFGGDEYGLSQVFIVMDAGSGAAKGYADELISATVAHMKASPRDTDSGEIRYPGERELRVRKQHMAEGVDVDDRVWRSILALRDER